LTYAKDPYANLADLYDSEANTVELKNIYEQWRRHLLDAIARFRIPVNIFVDLACGTGNSIIPLEKLTDWTLIGVDRSKSMLREARKKSRKVRWVCQDLRRLNLGIQADAATCHFDALNHILSARDLKDVFARIAGTLKKGALFQFDLSTDFFFRWLNGREKLYTVGKNYFVSTNCYDARKRIVTFRQLWFVKKGKAYERRDIRVREAAYTQAQVRDMLRTSGFRIVEKSPNIRIEGKVARLLYLVQKS